MVNPRESTIRIAGLSAVPVVTGTEKQRLVSQMKQQKNMESRPISWSDPVVAQAKRDAAAGNPAAMQYLGMNDPSVPLSAANIEKIAADTLKNTFNIDTSKKADTGSPIGDFGVEFVKGAANVIPGTLRTISAGIYGGDLLLRNDPKDIPSILSEATGAVLKTSVKAAKDNPAEFLGGVVGGMAIGGGLTAGVRGATSAVRSGLKAPKPRGGGTSQALPERPRPVAAVEVKTVEPPSAAIKPITLKVVTSERTPIARARSSVETQIKRETFRTVKPANSTQKRVPKVPPGSGNRPSTIRRSVVTGNVPKQFKLQVPEGRGTGTRDVDIIIKGPTYTMRVSPPRISKASISPFDELPRPLQALSIENLLGKNRALWVDTSPPGTPRKTTTVRSGTETISSPINTYFDTLPGALKPISIDEAFPSAFRDAGKWASEVPSTTIARTKAQFGDKSLGNTMEMTGTLSKTLPKAPSATLGRIRSPVVVMEGVTSESFVLPKNLQVFNIRQITDIAPKTQMRSDSFVKQPVRVAKKATAKAPDEISSASGTRSRIVSRRVGSSLEMSLAQYGEMPVLTTTLGRSRSASLPKAPMMIIPRQAIALTPTGFVTTYLAGNSPLPMTIPLAGLSTVAMPDSAATSFSDSAAGVTSTTGTIGVPFHSIKGLPAATSAASATFTAMSDAIAESAATSVSTAMSEPIATTAIGTTSLPAAIPRLSLPRVTRSRTPTIKRPPASRSKKKTHRDTESPQTPKTRKRTPRKPPLLKARSTKKPKKSRMQDFDWEEKKKRTKKTGRRTRKFPELPVVNPLPWLSSSTGKKA